MQSAFFRVFLFCLFFVASLLSAKAQTELIQLDPFKEKPLIQLIEETEKQYNLHYFFKESWIKDIVVSSPERVYLRNILLTTLGTYGIEVLFRENYVIFYIKDENYFVDPVRLSEEVLVIGKDKPLAALGKEVTWVGTVKDGKNQAPLVGVNVLVNGGEGGTVTDSQGNFRLVLVPGVYEVTFKYIGYEPSKLKVLMRNSGKLDVEVFERSALLNEVTILGEAADQNITSTNMGTDQLDIGTIEKIPAFMGEVDVIKSLLLLPGVSTVGEGAAGFNVRGGSADQNMVLFDQSAVYNSSHLFGFFSNFNPDVVDKVTLYKGGIPAAYGDRVSSVLDISSTRLTHDKFKLRGGIGLVTSRMVAEVPLVKDKSSVLIGGRITYSDWLLRSVKDLDIQRSRASFYDVNFKWGASLGEKDKITLSSYLSNDQFKFAADTMYRWQTKNASLSWDHTFNPQLSAQVVAAYGDYFYHVEGLVTPFGFELTSGLRDMSAGINLFYTRSSAHVFTGGLKLNYYQLSPGELQVDENNSRLVPKQLEEEQSREMAGYVQHEFTLNPKISFVTGVRYSYFQNMGPGTVLRYQDGETRQQHAVVDTLSYSAGEPVASYGGFEPRLSVKYSLNALSALKFSFNRIRQYLQVISNTAAVTPVDIWKSSDSYIRPLLGNQLSVGYFRNFKNNAFETSAEVYYKKLENVVDYKDGAEILLHNAIEQELVVGEGRAYGLELFVKKKTGRLTGWTSYTYSRSERLMRGPYEEEVINNGSYYPANFDQPHSLSVVADYQITRRLSFSANFVYNTGRPVTAPEAKFVINGTEVAYFSDRNQYRIPDYHRLDFSFTVKGGHRKKKILNGDWIFSLYNVYARQNAYSVYFKHVEGSPPQAYKLSVLGTVFPSITYNFEL